MGYALLPPLALQLTQSCTWMKSYYSTIPGEEEGPQAKGPDNDHGGQDLLAGVAGGGPQPVARHRHEGE